jgi:hypothetical protein
MINLREKVGYRGKYHPDFDFVEEGEEDLMIVAIYGKSGQVCLTKDEYGKVTGDFGLYVKCRDEQVIQNIKDLESTLRQHAQDNYTVILHCTEKTVVDYYEKAYGRNGKYELNVYEQPARA